MQLLLEQMFSETSINLVRILLHLTKIFHSFRLFGMLLVLSLASPYFSREASNGSNLTSLKKDTSTFLFNRFPVPFSWTFILAIEFDDNCLIQERFCLKTLTTMTKTKSLYPHPKYLFVIGIAKNWRLRQLRELIQQRWSLFLKMLDNIFFIVSWSRVRLFFVSSSESSEILKQKNS